jgi:hypothetical protein
MGHERGLQQTARCFPFGKLRVRMTKYFVAWDSTEPYPLWHLAGFWRYLGG